MSAPYRFLVKIDGRRRGAAVAHRTTPDGEPLCGVRLVGDDWTLARSAGWRRVCAACERVASASGAGGTV